MHCSEIDESSPGQLGCFHFTAPIILNFLVLDQTNHFPPGFHCAWSVRKTRLLNDIELS